MRLTKTGTAPADDSLLARIVAKAFGKMFFTTTGLRVDTGTINVTATLAANQVVAIGRTTQDGTTIQASQMAYNCGYRRNIIST